MPWCCAPKTLSYFWPWCLVLPFWSLDSVCFCGLAADRGSSFHVWTSGGCSSSWTVSNMTFYSMFSSLQIIRHFHQYCSVHLLCAASTECITVNFCNTCVSCRTSTSHFGIVICINFLVSLYCCESILYFINIWNTCWNEYNSNILWKYTLISSHFLCTTSFQTILYKRLSVVYFSLIRKIDLTSVLIICSNSTYVPVNQKKKCFKSLKKSIEYMFPVHLSALNILVGSSTLTFSQLKQIKKTFWYSLTAVFAIFKRIFR